MYQLSRKERDDALAKVEEMENTNYLRDKGVKPDDLDYVLFKVGKKVDDKIIINFNGGDDTHVSPPPMHWTIYFPTAPPMHWTIYFPTAPWYGEGWNTNFGRLGFQPFFRVSKGMIT